MPNAGMNSSSPPEPASKGISSCSLLPFGSPSLNAVSTSYHSSMVVGASMPTFSSQSLRIIKPHHVTDAFSRSVTSGLMGVKYR